MNSRLLVVLALLATTGCRHKAPEAQPQPVAFVADGGTIYRQDSSGRRALLALDSATAPAGAAIVPREWTPAPGSTFSVAAARFRHVVPSPSADWVAFETAGTHELVGVVPANGGLLKVLDFYFDSSADSVVWQPNGRYLNAFYTPPSGTPEVRVYDVTLGKRIK
ncbi:MAG: hypothetical protein H3C62_10120 [Gemmatimonadaceae bacterium]|nr:hypothetical protein [Gemmatimonadaceae bacterium]